MNTQSMLTMNEVRWLVTELNIERARLERSLAVSEATSDDAIAAQTQTEARRDALVAAMERVAKGTYGICEQCGNQIPFGRLLVMPEVTHCVTCQRRP